ncbi:GMC oxidoreductase [Aspergillus heteromorphus CBS 117.55]|uniref:GMC oxidoreductase n=1 Tax=Aspergillus heteromorphus CBS 117.55 TaxID=1448321 RepID=A0A317WUX1_9EURO|nr:GMC oxidoreductase [Aspergillus heteromorphus CBS 117.55]PWY89102.1 GMC oxidoreductase [Aspergillus heteromorphus CBS 117.55]
MSGPFFPIPCLLYQYPRLGRLFSFGVWITILLGSTVGAQSYWASELDGAQAGVSGVNASFDYIVVGAGTAGLTLAARLAEQKFTVAMIEAGDFYEHTYPLASIPGAAIVGIGADVNTVTPVDWRFVAHAVPGANYRNIHYARGKCLGGSSASNMMIYQRPNKEAMERWAEVVHDDSYTFRRVLPFFQRTANFTPPDNSNRAHNASAAFNMDAFTKRGEPLQVSYSDNPASFSSWMKSGMEAIGIRSIEDFNSGTLLGAQYCTVTIHPTEKTRSSSEAAFRNAKRPRLATMSLYRNTMAKKVLFNSKRRATGVQVRTRSLRYTLQARREVIVSAGAFQSPQLLMVSGVGPSAALKEHNIDVVVDLPGVGQNMWDHPFFGPSYRVNLETSTRIANDLTYMSAVIVEYMTQRRGPLTAQGSDYLAFEKLPDDARAHFSAETNRDLAWFPHGWPEAEYLPVALYLGNFSDPLSQQPRDGSDYATIIGTIIAPTSRGNVTIISGDTDDLPIINPNWLATKADQEVAIAIYRRIREAFHSEGMAPIVLGEEYFPGNKVQSDKEILEVIRNTVMPIFHASCTCKMGVRKDPMAVVDSRARVFGVDGLRVVDASAFPILPPGHPQSVAYMLAEKIAADIIIGPDFPRMD